MSCQNVSAYADAGYFDLVPLADVFAMIPDAEICKGLIMDEDAAPLVRTDFTDPSGWETLVLAVESENEMGFRACVNAVSDQRFAEADANQVVAAYPEALVVFIADARALKQQEILCIDAEDATQSFRARAADLWIVENNVSVGNILFEEFMEQVGEDGVLIAG